VSRGEVAVPALGALPQLLGGRVLARIVYTDGLMRFLKG
jgi:hypothetical protein